MKKMMCILLVGMLLFLTACASEAAPSDLPVEDKPVAVQAALVNVFGTPGDAALEELGLVDAPYDEDAGGMVAEYEWCGTKLETVVDPDWTGTGEVVFIQARTEQTVTEDVTALKNYVEQFTAQFGAPINYSTEISGEGRKGHPYDAGDLETVLEAFAALDADCALTFRFLLPDRTEADLEYAECAFYKNAGEPAAVAVSLHLMRLYEADYEVTDTPPFA